MSEAFSLPGAIRVIADSTAVGAAVGRVCRELVRSFPDPDQLVVVGITNGGVPFAEILASRLAREYGKPLSCGIVDVSFHRDDIRTRPIPKISFPTRIDVAIEGATVLLCDDVIASGRTVRAALNEIFDLGRPAAVSLAVLADRGGRKLPLQPDFTGLEVEVPEAYTVHAVLDPARPEDWSLVAREEKGHR